MEHHTLTNNHQKGLPALREQAGFAMLFTVLIVSLILSIALGISNLTLRQTILSSLAKDSGVAFYQADAAVECGMYQDAGRGNFQQGFTGTPTDTKTEFDCGTTTMQLDENNSKINHAEYIPQSQTLRDSNQPCFSIIFDKTSPSFVVRGIGYNTCAAGPRQVQRLLQVTYK